MLDRVSMELRKIFMEAVFIERTGNDQWSWKVIRSWIKKYKRTSIWKYRIINTSWGSLKNLTLNERKQDYN